MITFAPCLFLITFLSSITGSLQATCDENEFKCTDGSCIDSFLVCEGEKNCPDGSDETKACSKAIAKCPPFSFRCAYGACVDSLKKCNGKQDCADNSDENHPDCGTSTRNNDSLTGQDCHFNEFRCDSGQCITQWLICDGEENCRDGSDETEARCINFNCPIVGFQCNYGGCIDKDKKCNGIRDCKDNSDEDPELCASSSLKPVNPGIGGSPGVSSQEGCVLPDYPEGGSYIVGNCEDKRSPKCRGEPGTLVETNSFIVVNCWKGFGLSSEFNSSFCYLSRWIPDIPECLKLCKPLKDDSLSITCTFKDSPANCNLPVKPETKAKVSCKPYHTTKGYASERDPVCNKNGVWSEHPIHCEPECGRRTTNNVVPLVSFGTPTTALEYPWYSGLYSVRDFEHFCGGTVISPYAIITAAHCLYDQKNAVLDPSSIRITVGKTFRKWDVKEDNEQRFQVANIHIHPSYNGRGFSYGFDLALLELKGYIKIGSVSMPICVEKIQPWTTIPFGEIGTVVGFGRDEHNKPTDQLQVVNLTYADFRICKRKAPSNFKEFVTADKFCGLYKDGAGVQQGDSGGGIVFLKPEHNFYFIRGVVSTKPVDKNDFATFTNISEKTHMDFIKETLQEIDRNHVGR